MAARFLTGLLVFAAATTAHAWVQNLTFNDSPASDSLGAAAEGDYSFGELEPLEVAPLMATSSPSSAPGATTTNASVTPRRAASRFAAGGGASTGGASTGGGSGAASGGYRPPPSVLSSGTAFDGTGSRDPFGAPAKPGPASFSSAPRFETSRSTQSFGSSVTISSELTSYEFSPLFGSSASQGEWVANAETDTVAAIPTPEATSALIWLGLAAGAAAQRRRP